MTASQQSVKVVCRSCATSFSSFVNQWLSLRVNKKRKLLTSLLAVCIVILLIIFHILEVIKPTQYPVQLILKWSSQSIRFDSVSETSQKFTTINLTRIGHHSPSSRFQIIVLTLNRPVPLSRCLRSCRAAEYFGDIVDLTVWIDRSKDDKVDERVEATAKNFVWPHGTMKVNIWNQHVGLFGQWIDTYTANSDDELAVILEDDLEVSPLYYKWLMNARAAYSHRSDIFGYTLQRGTLRAKQQGLKPTLSIDPNEKAFLYLLVGSWGYSPNTEMWRKFRKWFHAMSEDPSFKPYVDGLKPTQWYKAQEKKKTMWTMWHIRYADENKLYTVYALLENMKTLASNWREPGLHFKAGVEAKDRGKDFPILQKGLLGESSGKFTFPPHPILVDWNGTYISRNGERTLI